MSSRQEKIRKLTASIEELEEILNSGIASATADGVQQTYRSRKDLEMTIERLKHKRRVLQGITQNRTFRLPL